MRETRTPVMQSARVGRGRARTEARMWPQPCALSSFPRGRKSNTPQRPGYASTPAFTRSPRSRDDDLARGKAGFQSPIAPGSSPEVYSECLIQNLGRLGRQRPDDFLHQLAVLLLPLRQHHLVTELEAVLLGVGREFRAAEHGGH